MKIAKNLGGWDTLLVATIVLTAGVCAQTQGAQTQGSQAQQDADEQTDQKLAKTTPHQPEGRIVRIAPDEADPILTDETVAGVMAEGEEADLPKKPTYWIGIRGRRVMSPVLRTQFQLAGDLGVVVEEVVPDSPAAKADLRKHDVILNAGGEPVLDMTVLQNLVRETGAKPIELQIIRLAKETTLTVVPEQPPKRAFSGFENPNNNPLFGFRGQLGLHDLGQSEQLRKMLESLQQQRGVDGGGLFGPGVMMGEMPNGVAVTMTREGNGPVKITVKQGDQSWDIVGDDQKAIEQLPENVRPIVESMLRKKGAFNGINQLQLNFGGHDLGQQMKQLLPSSCFPNQNIVKFVWRAGFGVARKRRIVILLKTERIKEPFYPRRSGRCV